MATVRTSEATERTATARHSRRITVLDRAPEGVVADLGCEVSPSCLQCPLAKCRYDDPGAYRAHLRQDRDEKIVTALNGMMIVTLAEVAQILREPRYRSAALRAGE